MTSHFFLTALGSARFPAATAVEELAHPVVVEAPVDIGDDIAAPATDDEGTDPANLAAQPAFDKDGAKRAGNAVKGPEEGAAVEVDGEAAVDGEEKLPAPPRNDASNACCKPTLFEIPCPAMVPTRADESKERSKWSD